MENKKIRAHARNELAKLSAKAIHEKSAEIQKRLIAFVAQNNFQTIGCYFPMSNEVQMGHFFDEMIKSKSVCFPRITSEQDAEMKFLAPLTLEISSWPKNHYGIPEPPIGSKEVIPTALDLIIVPGLAFDLKGNRLGKGKGYYDRYLAQAQSAYRVGIAFDCQLVPKIEKKQWDQSVNRVITESKVYRSEK